MKILSFLAMIGLSAAALAQAPVAEEGAITLRFKDGRTVATSAVRLQGRTVMAAVTAGGVKGEIGYPLDAIASVDFPKPPQLKAAADLLAQNKAAEALGQIAPVVLEFAPLQRIPGNWWAQAALMKLDALTALGREPAAQPLIDELVRSPLDPETMLAVRIQQAAGWAGKGDHAKAAAAYDAVIAETQNPAVLARAWLNKGHSLLAQRQWEPALFAFLHVPVFFPDQTRLVPAALLGSARALAGLGDKAAAEERLRELVDFHPKSPEAAAARTELEKLQKQQT